MGENQSSRARNRHPCYSPRSGKIYYRSHCRTAGKYLQQLQIFHGKDNYRSGTYQPDNLHSSRQQHYYVDWPMYTASHQTLGPHCPKQVNQKCKVRVRKRADVHIEWWCMGLGYIPRILPNLYWRTRTKRLRCHPQQINLHVTIGVNRYRLGECRRWNRKRARICTKLKLTDQNYGNERKTTIPNPPSGKAMYSDIASWFERVP